MKIDQSVNQGLVSQVEKDSSLHLKEDLDSISKEIPAVGIIQNSPEIDSLISQGADVEKIYGAMGMHDNAGYFTKKVYKQLLKLYKEGAQKRFINVFLIVYLLQCFFFFRYLLLFYGHSIIAVALM